MEIVTSRLVLREFTEPDLGAVVAYHSDPRYLEFYEPGEGDAHRAARLLSTFMQWAAERPRRNYQLAIVEREPLQTVIGCCGRSDNGEPDTAECGIELAPDRWGRGYAKEAMLAILAFGFGALALERVRALTVNANARAARLMSGLGFRACGERGGPAWMDARGWNQTEWWMTREHWEAAAASDLRGSRTGFSPAVLDSATGEPKSRA